MIPDVSAISEVVDVDSSSLPKAVFPWLSTPDAVVSVFFTRFYQGFVDAGTDTYSVVSHSAHRVSATNPRPFGRRRCRRIQEASPLTMGCRCAVVLRIGGFSVYQLGTNSNDVCPFTTIGLETRSLRRVVGTSKLRAGQHLCFHRDRQIQHSFASFGRETEF